MASDLLAIAKSGAKAARTALDVTAQNIANASSDGYIRRSVRLEEVSAAGGYGRVGDVSLSGVRVDRAGRYDGRLDCSQYRGAVCNYDCRPSFAIEAPRCVAGRCESVRIR